MSKKQSFTENLAQKAGELNLQDNQKILEDFVKCLHSNNNFVEKFAKWFWQGTNGNQLILKLNTYSRNDTSLEDLIRREKDPPTIYAIVVKAYDGHFVETDEIRLVKVGLTRIDTTEGTQNRMEQVMKSIAKKTKKKAKADIKLKLEIDSCNTLVHTEIEANTRNNIGLPLKSEIAKGLQLPVHTEWVVTTRSFISKIIAAKERYLELRKNKPYDLNVEMMKYVFNGCKHGLEKDNIHEDFQGWI